MNLFSKMACGIIAVAVFCIACKKPEDGVINSKGFDTTAKYTLTSFVNNGLQFKDSFANMQFQFASNLKLQVIKGGLVTTSDYRYENNVLTISGFAASPLSILNNAWPIATLSPDAVSVNLNIPPNSKIIIWTRVK
jgi:hypothetical protein